VLLSLSHKFLFIANVKTASSSIESALAPRAEIAIRKTEFGKHENLSAISKKFVWVKKHVPYKDFFVFGVVRDPIDWLLSLYNSHNKDVFDGKPHSTKGVPFGNYIREGASMRWQMRPQHHRFSDIHERFRVSHIFDYANLEAEFPKLCAHLGVEGLKLPKVNVSPPVLARDSVSEEDVAFIRDKYAEDYEFMANRPTAL
jgi:hypothetical protein